MTEDAFFKDFRPRKLLVINNAPIGDVILSSAAVRALRERYPDAHITWRTPAVSSELFKDLGVVNRVDADRPPAGGFARSLYRTFQAWKYRLEKYDACFFLEETAGFAKRLKSIPVRVCSALGPRGCANLLAKYCTYAVPTPKKQLHMVLFYLNIVCPDGSCSCLPWVRPLGSPEFVDIKEQKIAVCFEGSIRNRLHWPKEYAVALLKKLVAQGSRLFAFVPPGGSVRIADLAKAAGVDVCVRPGSLLDSARGLQSMDLLVSIDSGQTHLAAAIGVPVLSLAGVTTERTYPFTEKGVAICVADSCLTCQFLTECKSNKVDNQPIPNEYSPPCMTALTPDIVFSYAKRMLVNPLFTQNFIRVDREQSSPKS